jgi:hypothetical protein
VKAGGKGGGRNALLRMGFQHFYHLFLVSNAETQKNLRPEILDF